MINGALRTLSQHSDPLEAAAVGAVVSATTALITNPPAIFKRFYYYCQHNKTTLTNTEAKKAFDLFYRSVVSIINTTSVTYPEGLENCLEKFKNTLPGESDVYKFSPIATFDVRQIKEALRGFSLTVNGKRITEETLSSAVIDMVLLAPCMQNGEALSVPKIIFSFLVTMSLEFAATDNPVEKRDLVILMSEVAQSACDNREIRAQFEIPYLERNKSLVELKSLVQLFSQYLKNEHHLADSEKILIGAREFRCFQLERTKKRFNLLLTLTEGGVLKSISSTFEKIAENDLSIGRAAPTHFSNDNPFKELLIQTASIFPNVDESYNLIDPGKLVLNVPSKERIKMFVQKNIEAANEVMGKPSILYPLLRMVIQRGNTHTVQLIPKDHRNIETVTEYLFDLATGLAKDAEISLISAHFYIATKNNGQEWLEGYSAFMEEFMKTYSSSINTDDELLKNFQDYLRELLGGTSSTDHNIMNVIKALLSCNAELKEKGVKPLKDFSAYRLITTPVILRVQDNLKSFFIKTPMRLRASAISINESILRNCGGGSSTTLEAIKKILTNYAEQEDHQYKFRCLHLEASITLSPNHPVAGEYSFKTSRMPGHNDKHNARASLFLKLFQINVRENTAETEANKLTEIYSRIYKSLDSHFEHFTSDSPNGIRAILLKIMNLINTELSTQLLSAQRIAGTNRTVSLPRIETSRIEDDVLSTEAPASAGEQQINETPVPQNPSKTVRQCNASEPEVQPAKLSLNTQVTNFLKMVVNHAADKPDAYEAFELFWKKLFYLNNNWSWNIFSPSDFSKIREYQGKALLHKENAHNLSIIIKCIWPSNLMIK